MGPEARRREGFKVHRAHGGREIGLEGRPALKGADVDLGNDCPVLELVFVLFLVPARPGLYGGDQVAHLDDGVCALGQVFGMFDEGRVHWLARAHDF